MFIGQEVIVLDDGKRHRPTYGIIRAIGDNFLVIEHKVWGYGESQDALPFLYRLDDNGDWYSYQPEYSPNGVMTVFSENEYHLLCQTPTVYMWDNAFGKPNQ